MTTSDAKAPEGVNVAAFLEAPGLTSTLRDRLLSADANGDGVISASEMIDVLQSEADAIRDNKMMKRALIALGVACTLIIAANVGLTYAVVAMHKDTSVDNNVIVSKGGLEPLSTATLQKTVQLADLYKADSPSELDWLTHVTVPFGKGDAWLKIQNAYLIPGQSLRFDTAAEGVSVEVTADGVTVSGDEQAPGGRRRLVQYINGTVPTAVGAVSGSVASQGTGSSPSPPAPAAPPGSFYFASNGVTVMCPNAALGATGVLNGKTYTKRDRGGLVGLVMMVVGTANENQLAASCTTGVTDMTDLFKSKASFNQDIRSWDTSSVTRMKGMFMNALSFSRDLSQWNVSSVTGTKACYDFCASAMNFAQPGGVSGYPFLPAFPGSSLDGGVYTRPTCTGGRDGTTCP